MFRIDNFEHIHRAYGAVVARAAIGELNRTLADFIRDDGLVTPDPDGRIEILLWNLDLLGDAPAEQACERWTQQLCAAVAMTPIEYAGMRLHLAVSGAWAFADVQADDGARGLSSTVQHVLERVCFPGDAPDRGDVWAARYRSDMAAAAELLGAIRGDRPLSLFQPIDGPSRPTDGPRDRHQIALAWQPVRGAGDAGGVLYHECLVRLVDHGGHSHLPSGLVGALERLGLVRALDQYIVSAVIDELEHDPDVVLGANISAQSAQFDGWWHDIEQRLAADRSIAQRLVIEITESTAFPNISDAALFASRMRSLGCMIALDDLGTGFASIRQLLTLKPDIAKIDRMFIARSALSRQDRAAFIHLVGLARALVSIVVVEGVETEDQARLALEAGVHWQQGYFHGRPGVTRRWRRPRIARTVSPPVRSDLWMRALAAGRTS